MFRKLRRYSQCCQQPPVFLPPRSGVNPHTTSVHTEGVVKSVHMRRGIFDPMAFPQNKYCFPVSPTDLTDLSRHITGKGAVEEE